MNEGGSYVIKDGQRVRIAHTQDHPDGNRPRGADGRALRTEGWHAERAEPAAPAPEVSETPAPVAPVETALVEPQHEDA